MGFQGFENCKAVCFPHPSGSHGLSDDYIKLFSTEVGKLLQEFKDVNKHLVFARNQRMFSSNKFQKLLMV